MGFRDSLNSIQLNKI